MAAKQQRTAQQKHNSIKFDDICNVLFIKKKAKRINVCTLRSTSVEKVTDAVASRHVQLCNRSCGISARRERLLLNWLLKSSLL